MTGTTGRTRLCSGPDVIRVCGPDVSPAQGAAFRMRIGFGACIGRESFRNALPCDLTIFLIIDYSPITSSAEGRLSRGVVRAGRRTGRGGDTPRSRPGRRRAITADGRCGACGPASQAGTRATPGLRPEALWPPARSWLTAGGPEMGPSAEARPGVGVRTPRWCVERRGDPAKDRSHPKRLRRSAHHPPQFRKGETD